jgi:hypothetical protein
MIPRGRHRHSRSAAQSDSLGLERHIEVGEVRSGGFIGFRQVCRFPTNLTNRSLIDSAEKAAWPSSLACRAKRHAGGHVVHALDFRQRAAFSSACARLLTRTKAGAALPTVIAEFI